MDLHVELWTIPIIVGVIAALVFFWKAMRCKDNYDAIALGGCGWVIIGLCVIYSIGRLSAL